MPHCLRLFMISARAAASRTFCTAGTRRAIRTEMMAMTTSSSINVKPRRFGWFPIKWITRHPLLIEGEEKERQEVFKAPLDSLMDYFKDRNLFPKRNMA